MVCFPLEGCNKIIGENMGVEDIAAQLVKGSGSLHLLAPVDAPLAFVRKMALDMRSCPAASVNRNGPWAMGALRHKLLFGLQGVNNKHQEAKRELCRTTLS